MPTRILIARGSLENFLEQNSEKVQPESIQDGTFDSGSEEQVEPIPPVVTTDK